MQSRRTVLGHIVAGGVAATIAAPAIAGPDPVFGLIEAHRRAAALHSAALKEQERLELADDPTAGEVAEEPCHADFRAWRAVVNAAPRTPAGLRAWSAYLDEVRGIEEWMLEDQAPAIVKALAQALANLA